MLATAHLRTNKKVHLALQCWWWRHLALKVLFPNKVLGEISENFVYKTKLCEISENLVGEMHMKLLNKVMGSNQQN